MGSERHIAILLATKNGSRFLPEQLASFRAQTHSNWSLHASDDASTDQTCALIRAFAKQVSQPVTLYQGPCREFWTNFMSLVSRPYLKADYFAFSDQDDVWRPDKLERAVRQLEKISADTPSMYCSRTELIDERGGHLGFSRRFTRPPGFSNALVQNIGGGNTMLFNSAAKRILELTSDTVIVSHDWWTYQVVSAVGGQVIYDAEPSVQYRQHRANLVGSNTSVRGQLFRAKMIVDGTVKRWNEINLSGLKKLCGRMTEANQITLEHFASARSGDGVLDRLSSLRKSGVYRQTAFAQLGLTTAAILKML